MNDAKGDTKLIFFYKFKYIFYMKIRYKYDDRLQDSITFLIKMVSIPYVYNELSS